MNTSVVSLLFFAIIAGLILLIPVFIGIYVYKDAKSRNMDAVLWTLVAILVPGFIGLIIYLVIRGGSTNLNCPSCKNPITGEYVLCPYCGTHLKASCPSCAAAVDQGWKLCPKCGTELPVQTGAPDVHAAPKKDRKLLWILIAAITIPVVLLAVAVFGMISFTSSSSMMGSGPPVRYEDGAVFPDVADWVSRCDESGEGIYVLQFSPEKARELFAFLGKDSRISTSGNEKIYLVVVYVNQNVTFSSDGMECRGNTLQISYETIYEPDENHTDDSLLYDAPLIYAFNMGKDNKIDRVRVLIDGSEAAYSLNELE